MVFKQQGTHMFTGPLVWLQSVSSAEVAHRWAVGVWASDLVLTIFITLKVPYVNIDWETYMVQAEGVLQGQRDYSRLAGPTGPIAYPAGFCWTFAAFRYFELGVAQGQVLFIVIYMTSVGVLLEVYRKAGAPGWLMVLLMLSKRVHSVYVLRLFNDGIAQLFLYLSLLLFLQHRRVCFAIAYSVAVSIKMHPLLYCPAVGLSLVLSGGWAHALFLIMLMFLVQVGAAAPFLVANPAAYISRAFGGPGDLQQVWSVNWRMLPEAVFLSKRFAAWLLLAHLGLLATFAHKRWIAGGLLDPRLRRWCVRPLEGLQPDRDTVALWFACNFVGICCLRTIHFQYLVWYFHGVPLLAWYTVRPEERQGLAWVGRCLVVAGLTLAVEVPYLLTQRGLARGPDGHSWETEGAASTKGSFVLLVAHVTLLLMLAVRWPSEGQRPAAALSRTAVDSTSGTLILSLIHI